MTAFPQFKTRAEQWLEWLLAEKQRRRLTNEEWQQMTRCEHAVYVASRKRA